MIHRAINLSKKHSFFLFGARGTGKSSLLKELFSKDLCVYIDLLDPELNDTLVAYPNELNKIILPEVGKKKWVIIDEVQKAPKLLDIVHQHLSNKNFHFALTGSSARKLKRGSANLLAGRAFVFTLFPFTSIELGKDFILSQALQFGTLPETYLADSNETRARLLKAYSQTYLKEEIISEQLVRNLPPFRRFLDVAAACSTELINYSNIARDISSDPKTVQKYYEILEDTLIGFMLPAYHTSIRKQQKKAPKFYFFDCGVVRTLAGRVDYDLVPKSFEYGQLFESYIVNEINRLLAYNEQQYKLSFLRVSENQEIDLVIERVGHPIVLCEIKATERVNDRHASALETLGKEFPKGIRLLLSHDPVKKMLGKSLAVEWKEGLEIIVRGGI